MIDLARTFRNTLREWGHDILLQRRLNDDMLYSSKMERITVRSYNAQLTGQTNSLMENIEGLNVNSEMIYYFEASANPKSGDRIYEELSSGLESQILYVIEECYPVRGKQGKIEFWTVRSNKRKSYELTYAYSNTRSNSGSSICI